MRKPFNGDFVLTQVFGGNPEAYARFNIQGHNGLDYGLPHGSPVLAPHAGKILEVADEGNDGYGRYLKIESAVEGSVLAHLSLLTVKVGDVVVEGQLVGYSGNSGNVLPKPTAVNPKAGSHLHWGYYRIPRNRVNGFSGFIDQLPLLTAPRQDSRVYANTRNVTVTDVKGINIRLSPETGAALRNIKTTLPKDAQLQVEGFVIGEVIAGNSLWWKLKGEQLYVWTGATNVIPTIPKEPVSDVSPDSPKTLEEAVVIINTLKGEVTRISKNSMDKDPQINVLQSQNTELLKQNADLQEEVRNINTTKHLNATLQGENEGLRNENKRVKTDLDNAFVKAFEGWVFFPIEVGTNAIFKLLSLIRTLMSLSSVLNKEGAVIAYKVGAKMKKVGEDINSDGTPIT